MKLYCAETDMGMCIKKARDIRSARKKIREESGSMNTIKELRLATKKDIAWVKGMGGYIPD